MNKSLKTASWVGRIALFIVYFWFGAIKVFSISAVSPLVKNLLEVTLPFIPFETFIIILGIFEMVVGLLWLWPKATKATTILVMLHIFATLAPLVLLPREIWQNLLVPTLEGQFIIKNVLIIALAYFIFSWRDKYEFER